MENGTATHMATYSVGVQPMGKFPKTKITFLEALGDIAIDFDFAPPQLSKSYDKEKKTLGQFHSTYPSQIGAYS